MNTTTPKSFTGRLVAFAILSILAICADAPTRAAATDGARAAIEAQSKVFTDGVERGDARVAASVFTADAKLIVSGFAHVVGGRDSIESFLRSGIDKGLKGLRLTTIDLDGAGPLRVETGSYQVLGPGGGDLGRGHYMFVWKKENGAWKIHRDIGTELPASGGSGAAASGTPDRVGFPQDYRSALKLLSVSTKDDEPSVMTAYGNDRATSITASSQLPYPYGTVIAMEFAHGTRDGEGQLLRDPKGVPLKAAVSRIDVMRRERGYGEGYGDSRAGEWEFASYRPDGSTLLAPADAVACAACHRKVGAERDFVHKIRMPAR
jgi:ketosteroid isomerase-like protein